MRLQLAVDSQAKLTLLIVLICFYSLDFLTDSKTKVWVLYLGGDPREYGEGGSPVKDALMSRLLLGAAGSQSWATPAERLEHMPPTCFTEGQLLSFIG